MNSPDIVKELAKQASVLEGSLKTLLTDAIDEIDALRLENARLRMTISGNFSSTKETAWKRDGWKNNG